MKKIIVLAIALFTLSAVSVAQLKIGIKAGVNQNSQRINVTEGSIYGTGDQKGFHAGVIGELALGNNLYLQPQLLFSRKGADHLSTTGAPVTKIRMNYLELPVNLVYKFNLPFGKVIAGTGATYSYAVGGKATATGSSARLFYEGSAWNRQDLSLNFTTGFEFKNGLYFTLNSQKGLLDVHNSANTRVKNKSTSVSVGYLIDWKKFGRKA